MRRIIVVGSQGSGKTRLARRLGRKLGLPVIHLDVLYWRPGWTPSDTSSFRARVAEAIASDAWIVDGSFSGLAFDLTLAHAELLVVIERPRWLCQWRILWRSAFHRDTARPDLPAGCPEQFDWKLMREAWRYDVERAPVIEAERIRYNAGVPVVRLRSDRDIAEFVAVLIRGQDPS
ncbi:AAA family ATPase [Bradyrhizobium manausense]|uniref:AAA family ATPase n=1 Tax=Bradyrhizobium manausense TaxID=989370 RepID=UPI001BA6B19A|nr:AAA family ATPase [Bradyrhizobium manausense]MBR1086220.1 AAA family ATPase [Bradyrhizobium manausense]